MGDKRADRSVKRQRALIEIQHMETMREERVLSLHSIERARLQLEIIREQREKDT